MDRRRIIFLIIYIHLCIIQLFLCHSKMRKLAFWHRRPPRQTNWPARGSVPKSLNWHHSIGRSSHAWSWFRYRYVHPLWIQVLRLITELFLKKMRGHARSKEEAASFGFLTQFLEASLVSISSPPAGNRSLPTSVSSPPMAGWSLLAFISSLPMRRWSPPASHLPFTLK